MVPVRFSSLCLTVLALVGCASSKPTVPVSSALTYEQHLFAGEVLVLGQRCAVAGFMDIDSAAYLRAQAQEVLRRSYYLQHLLDEGIKKAEIRSIDKPYCVGLAMVASDSKRQEQNRRQSAASSNTVPGYVPPAVVRPAFTYCNRLGAQAFCSTY